MLVKPRSSDNIAFLKTKANSVNYDAIVAAITALVSYTYIYIFKAIL